MVLGSDQAGPEPPEGLPKMSDVLVTFAEPILDALDDDASIDDYRAALRRGSALWSLLAMMDREARRAAAGLANRTRIRELTALLDETVGGLDETGLQLVETMRVRRQTLFPGERRIFMDVGAELRGDRVHVSAASAPIQP